MDGWCHPRTSNPLTDGPNLSVVGSIPTYSRHFLHMQWGVDLMVKRNAMLRELKDLFEWVSSRYADQHDNLTAKDIQELRLRVRSLQSHLE